MIEFRDASVVVDTATGSQQILAPTTLTLAERRIGVIGANGSGKSTLARLINALVLPSSGSVHVDGHNVATQTATVRRRVGFVFTDPAAQLVMPTCVEDVELSLRRLGSSRTQRHARALAVLAAYGLAGQADLSVHALSGGQKQLLALAGVLATEPAIVVADEPTTLLDLANTRRVADELFAVEQQLILVTHDLGLASRCDRVIMVADGRVAADGPAVPVIAHYVATASEVGG